MDAKKCLSIKSVDYWKLSRLVYSKENNKSNNNKLPSKKLAERESQA